MDGAGEGAVGRTGAVGRRWRWLLGGLLMLAAIPAARVAWHYRPLNATERRFVGVWTLRAVQGDEEPTEVLLTLTADRRCVMSMAGETEEGEEFEPGQGTWSSTAAELSVRNDDPPWSWEIVRWMAGELTAGRSPFSETTSAPIRFVSDNHVTLGPVPDMEDITVNLTRVETTAPADGTPPGAARTVGAP